MADWRKLAKDILLADGRIDLLETGIVRRELFADGTIDEFEIEFLYELKRAASSVHPEFNRTIFRALKNFVLTDGKISGNEVSWLRRWILADGVVDNDEKSFLQDLKNSAKEACPEFEEFFKQCMAM